MLGLILCVAVAQAPRPETPGEVHIGAYADITRVAPERRVYVRYLSLTAYEEGQPRDEFAKTVASALNRISWRRNFATPVRVGSALLRVELDAYGLDRESRSYEIAKLKKLGVDTSSFKEDFWEEVVKGEPYFFTTTYDSYHKPIRGWLDPAADEALRTATYSSKAVVSAYWFVANALRDDEEGNKGGLYSQALLLPPTEGDLFKKFGVNEHVAEPGGAGVLKSDSVALHNRELQLFPALIGHDVTYLWRSLDVDEDRAGEKSVIDSLGGTLKRAGSEHIGVLPNGVGWGYICDAAGKQLAVVPDKVAHDRRQRPNRNVRDRRVTTARKCWECHEQKGFDWIYPFKDDVGSAALSPDIALVAKKKKDSVRLTDYYNAGLQEKAELQRSSYAARILEMNGRTPDVDSSSLCDVIESYLFDLVSLEQAAREAGRDVQAMRVLCRKAALLGSSQLAVLSSGQPIRRGAFEKAWADLMRADVYPWDYSK